MLKFELTEQELQIIGNALGKEAFNTAAPVVASLQRQFDAQRQPVAPPVAPQPEAAAPAAPPAPPAAPAA